MALTRRTFQAGFLALTLVGVFVLRGNAERWCPFGGVEALYTYATEGNMVCSLGVSNFYVLAGLLVSILLIRRAFCGYVCPIGTISEWIGAAGSRLGIGPARVPQPVERVLALLKYVVLGVILWVTWRAGELYFRGYDPCYALISRHGEDITFWAYVISGAIVVVSLLVTVPFCRWFCPLAAVMNPLSRFGLARVKRDGQACVDCGKCAEACPMNIPVHELNEVTSARCTSCLNCVAACPVKKKDVLMWGPPKVIGRRWPQAALVVILLGLMASVVAAAYAMPLPSFIKEHRVDQKPGKTDSLELRIEGVRCRGSAQLLTYFLFRDDLSEVPGYLKVEAWPEPGYARVRVTYDPARAEPEAIKEAIIEPYYDELNSFERHSPFRIEGYRPWDREPPWAVHPPSVPASSGKPQTALEVRRRASSRITAGRLAGAPFG
ncbi:MAG: 4Fe-4S binding protein [Phycisphaerae bacterium]|nr:4Fe-4S binding protein [Phycisphaerae bacterium]